MSLDFYLFKFLFDFSHRYNILTWLVEFIADYLIYLLIFALIYFLLFRVNSRQRLYLFLFTTLSIIITRGIVTELVRFFYSRPRPFVELDLPVFGHAATGSLPSGHMAFLIPIALAVWYENRKLGSWLLGLTILIGAARVASGLHWPTDIIAGIALGGLVFFAMRKFLPKS